MALYGKNTHINEVASRSDQTIPFTEVHIKKEQPDGDGISYTEDRSEQQLNEAVPFYSNGNYLNTGRPKLTEFTNNESEINSTVVNKAEYSYEEKPHILSFKSEINPNSIKYTENKEELDELTHEEIDIKVEIKDEWENNDTYFLNETLSTSSGSANEAVLNGDMEDQEKNKPFTCDHCNYKTTNSGNLKKHNVKHSGEKPFACNQCDYKCARLRQLKVHETGHSGDKPFSCDHCDSKFNHKSALKQHKLTHYKVKLFACSQCYYKTMYAKDFKQHQMKHSREKTYACDECNYETLYYAKYKQHRTVHSGKKPFACDRCDYSAFYPRYLKQHQMIHFEKAFAWDHNYQRKQYFCNQCDYKTIYSHALKRHHTKHSGEKRFTCDQCNLKFSYKSTLNRHQTKHSKEKPTSAPVVFKTTSKETPNEEV